VIPRRNLGASGRKVSVLGIGSSAVGGPCEFGWSPTEDQESIAAIRHAIDSGVDRVDPAPIPTASKASRLSPAQPARGRVQGRP
jgi:aryl-alcohol dehydrogenase-like predicted oxidoreductase